MHIVVGVSGGIAAVKVPELIAVLEKQGAKVSVVLTRAAATILPPRELGVPVFTDLFASGIDNQKILRERSVEHIALAKSADLLIVVPATANIIALLASGIANDYLTTVALAATCPIIVCPAMNVHMWMHPATQKNVATIKSFGMHIVEPEAGLLACGDVGQGRLASIETIAAQAMRNIQKAQELRGKTVLVTAGGTKEPIDEVRFIANRSSGKMGVALAEAAYQRGATVILLRAASSVAPRFRMEQCLFETADDLEKLMRLYIPKADICLHTAAVSDYKVTKHRGKLASNKKQTLVLSPREKLIRRIKLWNPKVFLVGFKAEAKLTDKELINRAKKSVNESGADFIAANHIDRPGQGFLVDTNEVFLVNKRGHSKHFSLALKREIAEHIMDSVSMF